MNISAPAITRLAIALALALAPALGNTRAVPVGFEDLVEGQTEQLDVSLFGQSAGLSAVRVTLDDVQLLEPLRVAQALGLSAEAQTALLPALSKPMLRNSHLGCRHGGVTPGCGYLPPPEAPSAVRAIYDEGEGELRLFVARQWIAGEDQEARRFHRLTANTEPAWLHRQTFSLSGGRDYQSLSAQGAGTLGVVERGHLAGEWNYSRQHYRQSRSRADLQVDNAYYRHDLGYEHYLQAGLMDRRNLSSTQGGTFAFGMLPLDRFRGLRFGTTRAYVDADGAMDASPLTLLLARDARVDVFQGDRLLQTFYLQAGVNQLDTRMFPLGSYSVILRIYEDGVLVRSEDAPFDKGGDWTDTRMQWFVQLGQRDERRSNTFDSDQALQMGMRVPVSRDVALTAGMADIAGFTYGEMRVDVRRQFTTQDLRGSFSVLRGSDGSSGQQHQVAYRRWASWNIYQQRMRGNACRFQNDTRDRLGCSDSLSASMSLPVAGGSAYLGYTRRQSWRPVPSLPGFTDGSFEGLLPWLPSDPPWPRGEPLRSRTWQASFSRTQRWSEFGVSSRVGLWQQNNEAGAGALAGADRGVFLSISLSRLQNGGRGSAQRRYAVDVRQPEHQRPDATYSVAQSLRQEVDADYREMTGEVRASNADRYSATVGAQLQNQWGQSGVTVAGYRQRDRNEYSYSANHASSFALSQRGLYWGGGMTADAGLAVQVDDTDDLDLRGVAAELQVGGSRRQRLKLGERRLLPLQAYQSHRVDLQDASAVDGIASVRVNGIGALRPLFLSPGRLVRMPVPIEVTYTFVGSARDIAGMPLGGARILNAPVSGTSANGGFVAEFPRYEKTLYLLQDTHLLQCPLQVRERRSVVLLVGAVTCEPLAVVLLPAEIREQARVSRLLQEKALIAPTPQTAAIGGTP